jgi:hypothetical protein
LERQAKGVAEAGLAHSEHHSAHAHPSAHMFIGSVRGFDGHDESFSKRIWIRLYSLLGKTITVTSKDANGRPSNNTEVYEKQQ